MRFPYVGILILCLLLVCGCTQKPDEMQEWPPVAKDGRLTLKMNHIGMEDHFFGKWDAPQLGREQKFFRYALQPKSGIYFYALKPESYFVEVQLYEAIPDLEIRVNERVFPISGQKFRKLIPSDNIEVGRNRIVFSSAGDVEIGIQQINIYPKRYENIKTQFDPERDFLTPVEFHFYGNPQKQTKLQLSFLFPSSQSVSAKVTVASENNKKEFTQSILSQKSFQVSMLDEGLHHIKIEIPDTRSRYIKLEQSLWIEPRQDNPQWQNLQTAAQNKNILLILLDAARSDHMSYSGYVRNTTPNIDALAAKSFVFTDAFSEAAYTLASTGTLLTGLPPDFHGVVSAFFSRLRDDILTFPELLKANGYFTAAVSANPFFSKAYNFNRGFDQFIELSNETYVVGAEEFTAPFEHVISNLPEKPFFIYLHLREPHHPYIMPKPFFGKYQQKYSEPSEEYIQESTRIYLGEHKGSADFEFLTDIYDENLEYADSVVGEILYQLESFGLDKDTIVIITSDHGEALGEHDMVGHNVILHKEGIHIPMLFHLPDAQIRTQRFENPVITSDLVITLCELLGIDYPYPDLTLGRNLFSLSEKRTRICRSMILSDRYSGYMVESFPYRAIIFPKFGQLEVQLFDIYKDPGAKQVLRDAELAQDILANYLSQFIKKAAKGFRISDAPRLSEKERESLKALGYIK